MLTRFWTWTALTLLAAAAPLQAQMTGTGTGTSTGAGAGLGSGAGIGSGGGIGAGGGIGSSIGPGGTSTTGGAGVNGTISGISASAPSGAGSLTTIPSSANPFRLYYGTPQGIGLPSNYTNTSSYSKSTANKASTFGQPLYGKTTTNTNATLGTGLGALGNTTAGGFNSMGIVNAPQYATVLGEDLPLVVHAAPRVLQDVRSALARSTHLSRFAGLDVQLEGATLVLKGRVATDRERRLVEGMARLTPGVRDLRNDLQLVETAPAPRP